MARNDPKYPSVPAALCGIHCREYAAGKVAAEQTIRCVIVVRNRLFPFPISTTYRPIEQHAYGLKGNSIYFAAALLYQQRHNGVKTAVVSDKRDRDCDYMVNRNFDRRANLLSDSIIILDSVYSSSIFISTRICLSPPHASSLPYTIKFFHFFSISGHFAYTSGIIKNKGRVAEGRSHDTGFLLQKNRSPDAGSHSDNKEYQPYGEFFLALVHKCSLLVGNAYYRIAPPANKIQDYSRLIVSACRESSPKTGIFYPSEIGRAHV